MLKKLFFILLIIHVNLGFAEQKVDPLSKIVITSQRAICQKDIKIPKIINFTYLDNVIVTFADKSNISCDQLGIELNALSFNLDKNITTTTGAKQPNSNFDQLKRVSFKDHVKITKENKTVESDNAELFVDKKICKFIGNVKITQIKKHKKDVPMVSFCDKAVLDMRTEKINFIGSEQSPVSTTIELTGHPGLLKKVKTKAEKKAEKKAARKRKLRNKKTIIK